MAKRLNENIPSKSKDSEQMAKVKDIEKKLSVEIEKLVKSRKELTS